MTSPLPDPVVPELDVPIAWSGTADITVTVEGDCAAAQPSEYLGVPADIAVNFDDSNTYPDGLQLTIGINPGGLPSIAVYSSLTDDDGVTFNYWDLDLSPAGSDIELTGEVVNDSADGPNPNLMVDAETALQPCEPEGTVALPRILDVGSSLHGVVSNSTAHMTITAATTDGKREVSVELSVTRID